MSSARRQHDATERQRREAAWIGDAVLGLWVRQWLLDAGPADNALRTAWFQHFTSNQFLAAREEPTTFEARIGTCYTTEGLEPAFALLRRELHPRMEHALNRARRARPGQPPRPT